MKKTPWPRPGATSLPAIDRDGDSIGHRGKSSNGGTLLGRKGVAGRKRTISLGGDKGVNESLKEVGRKKTLRLCGIGEGNERKRVRL